MSFDCLAYPESCLFFLIGFVALVFASIFKKNLFSPPLLYVLVQSIMFGIAYLKLMPAMTDYHLTTWLVWGGGAFSFLTGCFLVRLAFVLLILHLYCLKSYRLLLNTIGSIIFS
jgi:hypothetical protein